MPQDTDVIIIGAGPAGLTAAITLSELDVPYMLFDRNERPGEKKTCGGFIPSRALREFNMRHINGQHEVYSLRLKFPGLDIIKVDFEDAVGVNIRRENLFEALIDRIPKNHNHIHLASSIDNIKVSSSGCKVTISHESDSETLTSNLVIDGSGVNPVSQRFIALRKRPSNSQIGYAMQYHLQCNSELDGVNDFFYGGEYSPRGYAWIFPCRKISVIGTGGLIDRVRKNDTQIERYLTHLISEVGPTRSDLEGARIIRKETALMPLAGVVRPSFGKRVLLVGDAACQCSPISGEGIFYAMIGGREAALTASICAKKSDFSDNSLSHYEKSWTDQMGSDLKWGLYLQRKFTESGSRNIGSGFLKSDKSARIIAEMLVGERSVKSAIIKAAPSYIKSKIR